MATSPTARTTQIIPLDLIDAPTLDARISRDPEKLEELARDILRRGLIEPIKVVAVDPRFEVVDGYRRYLAAKHAGLSAIECFVYPTKEAALEGVKYAANVFREDMSPAEEAVMFHELLTHECGNDIERLAALTGKSINYVDNRLQLLYGDELVFEAIKDRKVTIGVAQELNKLPDSEWRRYYLNHAMKTGATVGVVRAWVSEWTALYGTERQPQPAAPAPSGDHVTQHYDPHTCYICRKTDARYIPEQVNVHTHCRLAVLDPLLDSYHGSDGKSE